MEPLTLNRQQLFELVWSEPMLTLSKKYNMSDVGLRKLCARMNVPIPKTGHWQRVRAGRKVKLPLLPTGFAGKDTVTLTLREDNSHDLSQLEHQIKMIETDPKVNLVVPKRLSNPHHLIIAARRSLIEDRFSDRYGLTSTHADQLNITISPKNLGRSLRIMDTVIKAIYARGHEVEVDFKNNYAVVYNERIKFNLREKTRQTLNELPGSYPKYHYVPTGVLAFQLDNWNRYEWNDKKQPLEEQVSRIIARLELEGQRLAEITLRHKREREEREEAERVQRELVKRRKAEQQKLLDLLNEANRWHQASLLRSYLGVMQSRGTDVVQRGSEWLDWAQKKILWLDPLIGAKDDVLTKDELEDFNKFSPGCGRETNPWNQFGRLP